MKFCNLIALLFLAHLSVFAQKKGRKIFKINGESIYTSEFEKLFLTESDSLNYASFDENLELMLDYKLKLNEAKAERLDTLPALKREYDTYKQNLAKPYLTDKETLEALVKEAYYRTFHKISASHILAKIEGKDTLPAYKKISEIKEQLKNGADFGELAAKVSDDLSAKNNKGFLGYFNAFKMVYPFESAAYNTEVGEISDIVRTRFGYHLLKVDDKFKVDTKTKVAHIMIFKKDKSAEQKIKDIYKKLESGADFGTLAKELSQDRNTSKQGGLLKPFTKGTLPKAFEDVSFALENEKYSKPFKTDFGWHIVKKYADVPVESFEEMEKDLRKSVKKRPRGGKVADAVYEKIAAKHKVISNEEALKVFEVTNLSQVNKDSLNSVLLSIDEVNYTQKDFYDFLGNKRLTKLEEFYKQFRRERLKEYFIGNLENEDPEFKETLSKYKNGLIIFELMKKNIWDVPSTQKEDVAVFYEANKEKYADKGDSFEKVKGYVESDYQEKIEKEWLASLREKSEIKRYKRNIKKLKKSFK